MEQTYLLSPVQVFTLFFIMLGPLKMLAPFLRATKSLSTGEIHTIAWRSALIAAAGLAICGYVGKSLLINWTVPIPILQITVGLIFFIFAMKLILAPKLPRLENSRAAPLPKLNGFSTALTMIMTPYGAASIIGLLAVSQDIHREIEIFISLLAVMFLNYLAMFFIRQIMSKPGMVIMQLLGVILGVLQASLALHLIYIGIKMLDR